VFNQSLWLKDCDLDAHQRSTTQLLIMIERRTYQVHPMAVQLDVKLTYSPPFPIEESLHITGDFSL
jgi:hypothetical protein